jgi:GntR family transcriptional regulator
MFNFSRRQPVNAHKAEGWDAAGQFISASNGQVRTTRNSDRSLISRRTMCYSTARMVPFRVEFRPGISLYEQIVYAAKKAIVERKIRPGDAFPSVRVLSKELKINPNTAHKVVTHLVAAGLLESKPGIGTVVVPLPESTAGERTQLLGLEIEQLVVEAKKLGIGFDDLFASVSAHWKKLEPRTSESGADRDRGGRGK